MNVRDYWQSLAARERFVAVFGGAFLMLVVGYVTVHEPLMGKLAQTRATLAAEIVTLESLQDTLAAAKELRGRAPTKTALPSGQSAISFVNESASEFSLAQHIRRIVPGGDTLSVVMEAAPFDAVMAWLTSLARAHHLHVSRLSVERVSSATGAVNLNLVFEMP